MKKIRIPLFIFGFFTALTSCSTSPSVDPATVDSTAVHPAVDYRSVVDSWTQKAEDYANFASTYQLTAVFLSRELVEAQVRLDGERFNWSQEEIQNARQKALYDLQTQTTFLLSLYTNRDEDNNLEKAAPAWNLYIEVNGKHIIPQSVKRIYENRVSLMQKYPTLNVWSRNYYVKFPIPSDDASSSGVSLIMAGPLGTTHLKFK